MAKSVDDIISVRRSNGKVEELSAEQLEQLNYERKVRDQESTGHFVTSKQINFFAVSLCIVVLVYALPQIFFSDKEEKSTYIPLKERNEELSYSDLYDLEKPFDSAPNPEQALSKPQDLMTAVEPLTTVPVISAKASALLKEQQKMILKSAVVKSVQDWASSWSAQDVDGYLSHYSSKFISDKGMNIDEWKAYRSIRVTKPSWVQVMLIDIEVEMLSDSLAQIQFTQNYSASNYQEVSPKALSLEATNNGWKILTEANLN